MIFLASLSPKKKRHVAKVHHPSGLIPFCCRDLIPPTHAFEIIASRVALASQAVALATSRRVAPPYKGARHATATGDRG